MLEHGRPIGRMYEDLHALPDLRWFWSITIFVGHRPGVTTNGRVATLNDAKARFVENWIKCRQQDGIADYGAVLLSDI